MHFDKTDTDKSRDIDDPNKVVLLERNDSLTVTDRISVSWHNLDVYGNKTSKTKRFFKNLFKKNIEPPVHIVKNVSGQIESGKTLALMGASGAGKTTLLNVLTGRNLSDVRVDGVVKLNGKVADINSITALSAYVQQDDLFIGTLTVREHLLFQSLVRMDQNITKKERIQRINQVIKDLGLKKCSNTRIGTPGSLKGISGGEMKRLAFASEVLTNPSIMFCDEPTSGLDAFMAQSVVSVLKTMASQGRTIISTIHQPSSEVFAMFDYLLLLANGRVAYLGKLSEAVIFFSSLHMNCPTNYNPADFYIYELAIAPGKEKECKKKVDRICDEYLKSSFARESMPPHNEEKKSSFVSVWNPLKFNQKSRYKANCWRQFIALLWRSFLIVIREPMITSVRLIQTLAVALILGIIYWDQEYDQKGVQNINGAIFLLLTNMTFQNAFAVINTFCLEVPIFLREHNNGMYRVDTYFFSKMLAEMPVFIAVPLVFVSVYYFMIGLNNSFEAFIVCAAISTLVGNVAASFGYMLSAASSSVTMALSIGPPLMIPLLLFGGFFLNNASVPIYFIWLKYFSWFYYGNEALMINQWQDIEDIKCESSSDGNATQERCLKNGQMVLQMLSFNENNLNRDILLLIALLLFYRFLAYIALLIKARKR